MCIFAIIFYYYLQLISTIICAKIKDNIDQNPAIKIKFKLVKLYQNW